MRVSVFWREPGASRSSGLCVPAGWSQTSVKAMLTGWFHYTQMRLDQGQQFLFQKGPTGQQA
jgi:hypothetical protein